MSLQTVLCKINLFFNFYLFMNLARVCYVLVLCLPRPASLLSSVIVLRVPSDDAGMLQSVKLGVWLFF